MVSTASFGVCNPFIGYEFVGQVVNCNKRNPEMTPESGLAVHRQLICALMDFWRQELANIVAIEVVAECIIISIASPSAPMGSSSVFLKVLDGVLKVLDGIICSLEGGRNKRDGFRRAWLHQLGYKSTHMYCSMGSAVVELSDEDIDESSSIQCKEGTEDSSSPSEEVEEEASLSLDKAPLLSLLL